MGTEPRRIVRIGIDIFMPAKAYSAKDRIVLERVAQTCPVYYSLNEHLEKVGSFSLVGIVVESSTRLFK